MGTEKDTTLVTLNAYCQNLREGDIRIELEFDPKTDDNGKSYYQATESSGIRAPRQGDEAMDIIATNLQSFSDTFGVTIRHVGAPSNDAAADMFQRTKGYQHLEDTNQWVRTFEPKK